MNYWTESDVAKHKELGVKVLFHCTNTQVTDNSTLPSNSYIIGIQTEEYIFEDIAQGTMISVFDAYYDKFGSKAIKYIKVSKGRVNPRFSSPNKKKK